MISIFAVFSQACDPLGMNAGDDRNFMDESGRWGTFTPKPMFMDNIPQGDDDYSKGFRDGCNTAISLVGTGFQTLAYDDVYYDFDKLLDSSDYYKGKTIGMDYCTYFIDVDPL